MQHTCISVHRDCNSGCLCLSSYTPRDNIMPLLVTSHPPLLLHNQTMSVLFLRLCVLVFLPSQLLPDDLITGWPSLLFFLASSFPPQESSFLFLLPLTLTLRSTLLP